MFPLPVFAQPGQVPTTPVSFPMGTAAAERACKQTLAASWPGPSLALVAHTGHGNQGHPSHCLHTWTLASWEAGGGRGGVSGASQPLGVLGQACTCPLPPHGHPNKQGL